MTSRHSMIRLVRLTLVLLPLQLASILARADLSDLPVGHLKITNGKDQTINVEARCVPTKDLINTLAQRTGASIQYDQPCLTYVSIWRRESFEPVDYWIKLAATLSESSEAAQEDGVWRLRPSTNKDRYDPALTEAEIIARYKGEKTIHPLPPKAGGIESGAYVFHSQFIPGPYVTEIKDKTPASLELMLNGVVLQEYRIPRGKPVPSQPPSNGQFSDPVELRHYVTHTLYPKELARFGSKDKALISAIQFLRTQDIVQQIENEKPPVTVVLWKVPAATTVFPENYDYDAGSIHDVGATPMEVVECSRQGIEQELQQGQVIIDSGSQVILSAVGSIQQLISLIELATPLSIQQAECVLSELLEDRSMAREWAVNLPTLARELVPVLQKMVADRQRSASSNVPAQ